MLSALAALAFSPGGARRVIRACAADVRSCSSSSSAVAPRTLRTSEATDLDWRRVLATLTPFTKEERVVKLNDVLAKRRGGLHIVLDGVADPFDAAAVMRTIEGLGVQEVHVIEAPPPSTPRPRGRGRSYRSKQKAARTGVAMGASRWLTVRHYRSPEDCCVALRSMDLSVFASCAPPKAEGKWGMPTELEDGNESVSAASEVMALAQPIGKLPFGQKRGTALVFNNRLRGSRDHFLEYADAPFYLPVSGLTQVRTRTVRRWR